ncbi:MAG: di-trans,poly-cis-decaprenylcistransferase [Armatimonadetes bacterium]|jgi:undecaprenyl diphosphate synthase|nr:di-trans,poly-cis-decaprenylcistransferase [Armatimonadota bacterium]
MNRMPEHIAIIMDGNGRWATRQGMERSQGHFHGYRTLHNTVIQAAELGVGALSAYTFSSENWSRPDNEVTGLMDLVVMALRAEIEVMMEEGVRIIRSGRREGLPQEVLGEFDYASEQTQGNDRITLNICLNYGGRNEIVDAARQAAQMAFDGKIAPKEIDENLLSSLMYHPELPDPDLLIRTAGEMRVSNFLLWEIAYSEIYVTQTLWPDFSEDELVRAIAAYQSRTRKYGAVVDEQ